MARGCSPKGVVKKHNLYNKHSKDWGRGGKGEGREGEGRGRGRERGGEGKGGEGRGEPREGEGRGGEGEGRGREQGEEGELERDCTYHPKGLLYSHHTNVRLCGQLLSTVQIHHYVCFASCVLTILACSVLSWSS